MSSRSISIWSAKSLESCFCTIGALHLQTISRKGFGLRSISRTISGRALHLKGVRFALTKPGAENRSLEERRGEVRKKELQPLGHFNSSPGLMVTGYDPSTAI